MSLSAASVPVTLDGISFSSRKISELTWPQGLTTAQVVSVANPALGNSVVYTNNSGVLSSVDSLGNVLVYETVAGAGATYLPLAGGTMTGDIVMGSNNVTGLASESFAAEIQIRSATGGSNILMGPGSASAPANSSFVADLANSNSCVSNAANQILMGTSCSSNGQNTIALGNGITSTNNTQVNLGLTISNAQANAVALGPNITLSAGGQDGICIGSGSSIAAASSEAVCIGPTAACTGLATVALGVSANASVQNAVAIGRSAAASGDGAIAIGYNAANATAHSVLLGDASVANVRANSAVCDLGTSAVPFASARLGALRLQTGADKTVGAGAVMVAGAVTVATTAVSTGDIVLLSRTAVGGTTGQAYISAINNGVSFVITSDSALDTSTFSWVIVKQA